MVQLWMTMFKFVLLCIKINMIFSTSINMPPLTSPNNIIKLIIKTYINDLLQNQHLPDEELRLKLNTMSNYISNHPALHQRYLWVGAQPPQNYNPDHHMIQYDRNTTKLVMRKRDGNVKQEQLPSEEICETKEKWEQINETHDLFDNKVKVIQEKDMQQFVFTYRCAKNKGKCLGISPLFESECTERYGWMYMYYKPEDKPAQWGFVNAPHHCACKLKPKFYQQTISSENSLKRK